MESKTRSIYFSNGVYRRIEAEARERGLTINSYVVQCSDPLGPLSKLGSSVQLDRIEGKVDVIKDIVKASAHGLSLREEILPDDLAGPAPGNEPSVDIEAENAKLLAKREKIMKIRDTGYFNPQPKASSKGKGK